MRRITFEWNDLDGGAHIYSRDLHDAATADEIQAEYENWLRWVAKRYGTPDEGELPEGGGWYVEAPNEPA